MFQQGQLGMRLELFLEGGELLTVHPARTAWGFARRKLATLPEPAQVPFYCRVTYPKGAGCLTNAEVALQHSFDDPFS